MFEAFVFLFVFLALIFIGCILYSMFSFNDDENDY